MVGPTCQGSVNPHCGRERVKNTALWRGNSSAFGRIEVMTGCIAMGPELWFEKPGLPSGPAAPRAEEPDQDIVSVAGLRSTRVVAAAPAGETLRRRTP